MGRDDGNDTRLPAMSLGQTLQSYWPGIFAVGTMSLMLLVDEKRATPFPPALDPVGNSAKLLRSPWFLGTALPTLGGLAWLRNFARRERLPPEEHCSMAWWICNLFWFHVGCDLLSGLYKCQPVLTGLYAHMNPRHLSPVLSDPHIHLTSTYLLELVVEVPLAACCLWLYKLRHPARHFMEAIAAAVQLAGTVVYYMPCVPVLAHGEPLHTWLSIADRLCGSVWILFPCVLFRRNLLAIHKEDTEKMA